MDQPHDGSRTLSRPIRGEEGERHILTETQSEERSETAVRIAAAKTRGQISYEDEVQPVPDNSGFKRPNDDPLLQASDTDD
jgi:hypothetical protein